MTDRSIPHDSFEDVCLSSDDEQEQKQEQEQEKEEQEFEKNDSVVDDDRSTAAPKPTGFRLFLINSGGEPAVLLVPVVEPQADGLSASEQDLGSETPELHNPVQRAPETEAAKLLSTIQDVGNGSSELNDPTRQQKHEAATLVSSMQDLDSQTAVTPTEQCENEEALPISSVHEYGSDTDQLSSTTEQCNSEAVLPHPPTHEYGWEVIDQPPSPIPQCKTEAAVHLSSEQESGSQTDLSLSLTELCETEKAVLLSSEQKFGSQTELPSSHTAQCEIEAALTPSSVKEFSSEIDLPPSHIPQCETEKAILLSPTQEFDGETDLHLLRTEECENEAALTPSSVKEVGTSTNLLPSPILQSEPKAALLLSSAQGYGSHTDLSPSPTEEYETEKAVLLSSNERDIGSQTNLPPKPTEQCETEAALPLSPAQEFGNQTGLPPTPVEQRETEASILLSSEPEFGSGPGLPPTPIEQCKTKAALLFSYTQQYGSKANFSPFCESEAVLLISSTQEFDDGDSDSDTWGSYCTAVSSLSDLDDSPDNETCPPCPGPAGHLDDPTPGVKNPVSVGEFNSNNAREPSTPIQVYGDAETAEIESETVVPSESKYESESVENIAQEHLAPSPMCGDDRTANYDGEGAVTSESKYESESDVLLSSIQDVAEDPPTPEQACDPETAERYSETTVPSESYYECAHVLLSSIEDIAQESLEPRHVCDAKTAEVHPFVVELDGETAVPLESKRDRDIFRESAAPRHELHSESYVPSESTYERESDVLLSSIGDIAQEPCTPEQACDPETAEIDGETTVLSESNYECAYVLLSSLEDIAHESPPPTQVCDTKTAEVHPFVVELDSKTTESESDSENESKCCLTLSPVEDIAQDSPALRQECDAETAEVHPFMVGLDNEIIVPPRPVSECGGELYALLSSIDDLESIIAVSPTPIQQTNKEAATFLSPVQNMKSETALIQGPVQQYDNEAVVDLSTVQDVNTAEDKKSPPYSETADSPAVRTSEVKMCAPCPPPRRKKNQKTAQLHVPVPVLEFDSDVAAIVPYRQHCDDTTVEHHCSVQELNSETAVSQAPIRGRGGEVGECLSSKNHLTCDTAVLKYENEPDVLPSHNQEYGHEALQSEASVYLPPIKKNNNKADTPPSYKRDPETPVGKGCPRQVKTAKIKSPASAVQCDSEPPAVFEECDNATVGTLLYTQKLDCDTVVAAVPIQDCENGPAIRLLSTEEDKACPPCPESAERPEVKIAAPAAVLCSDTPPAPPPRRKYDNKTTEFPIPVKEPDTVTDKDKSYASVLSSTEEYENKAAVHFAPLPESNFVKPALLELHSKTTSLLSSSPEVHSGKAIHLSHIQVCENKAAQATWDLDSDMALFTSPLQQMNSKTAVLPLLSSSATSPVASESDISYRSLSVNRSYKPMECRISPNSLSAARTCRLTHQVSPLLAGTNKGFDPTAHHNSDISAVQTGHVPLSKPSTSPRANTPSRDIVKVSMTNHADTDTRAGFCSPPPSSSLDTILITPQGNQYNRDGAREISGSMPTEVPPKQGPCLAEVAGSRVAEAGRPSWGQPITYSQPEEGEGQGMEASCRVEQTELSLTDRNRKASASCIPTLTGDARKSGIPVHCYSECILATGQQHQPQSATELRRWQKQSGQVAWRSRVVPHKVIGSSRKDFSATQKQSSGKNNMGTKLSQTESEVKTLSNLPAKTFSCPDTNYLDVNNLTSSRPSSTEPYTDSSSLNGWAAEVEDGHGFKLPMPFSQTQNNTSACSEASSVECIVVALETQEEVQRGSLKTVPKRQIQLKRKDTAEAIATENHDQNQPQEAPPTPSRPRDIFLRQHSTPAAFHQEPHGPEQRSVQAVRKQRLQKSLSLDETSSKTKIASCLIKNVLSKKMQHEQGFRGAEPQENAVAPLKAAAQTNGNVNYQPAKESTPELDTKMNSNSTVSTQHRAPSQSPPLKAPVGSIKEHISVSSKTQQKPMMKHSFNPLYRTALGRAEFQSQSDSPEITAAADGKKAEKPIPRDEAVLLPSWSPGDKLSCDSAKGKAWKTSTALSTAATASSQAGLKATPEECGAAKGNLKQQPQQQQQQHVKTQLAAKTTWEKDARKDKLNGTADVPVQKISGLLSDQELSSDESPQPLTPECLVGSLTEKGESKAPGHYGNPSTHDILKGIAPVHVVRDVRSLVKNTYNLSFRGSDDTPLGYEDGGPSGIVKVVAPQCRRVGERGSALGSVDKHMGKKAPTSPAAQVEKIRDLSAQHNGPRGGLSKRDTGFTKVSPNSLFTASSCPEPSGVAGMAGSASLCKLDAPSDNTKCKHAKRAEGPPQALPEPPSATMKLLIDGDVLAAVKQQEQLHQRQGPGEEGHSPPQVIPVHGFATAAAAPQCFTSTSLLRDSFVSPSLTPVLTAALSPTQVMSAYYYKPNALSYQAISPHVGTVGYVQGPMILQTSAQAIPSAGTGTLVKHITDDSRRASLSSHAEKRSGHKGSPKQTGDGESQRDGSGDATRPSPEAQQQYLCGTQTIVLAPEGRRSSAGTLYPELSSSAGLIHGQAAGPRHLLVDPETGRCFYMDVPAQPQPQRKMLFDPETCQYVEVLLPQQTMPSAVMSPTCAVSLPFPAVYTPNCLPYLQSHAQVLHHPGP
ncbi:uncharacterized protein prob1 [Engraulis encrasicolus]|uniref:uncharacterized protein prob1 n=1 Tax=Engraulis encrasicolus TaxID=184585 RepID=UPI002FD14E38